MTASDPTAAPDTTDGAQAQTGTRNAHTATQRHTDAEIAAIARRAVTQHVDWPYEWLLWEDLPFLGEYDFDRVLDAVAAIRDRLILDAAIADQCDGTDSRYLWAKAVTGKPPTTPTTNEGH